MISARGSTKCASEQMGQPPRAGLCVYITIVGPARRVQKPRPLKCPAWHTPGRPPTWADAVPAGAHDGRPLLQAVWMLIYVPG